MKTRLTILDHALPSVLACSFAAVGSSACSAAAPIQPEHIAETAQAVNVCASSSSSNCWQTAWSSVNFGTADFSYNLMCGGTNTSGPSQIVQCYDSNVNSLATLMLPGAATVQSVSTFVAYGVNANVWVLGSDSVLYGSSGTLPPSGTSPYFNPLVPVLQAVSSTGTLTLTKVVVIHNPNRYAPDISFLALDASGCLYVKRAVDTFWVPSWGLSPWNDVPACGWADISRDPGFGAYLLDNSGDVVRVGQGTTDAQDNVTYNLPQWLPILPDKASVIAVGGPFVLSDAGRIACSSNPNCQNEWYRHSQYVYPLTVSTYPPPPGGAGFDGDSQRFWYWNGSSWTNLPYENPNPAEFSNCAPKSTPFSTPIGWRCFSNFPPFLSIVEATSLQGKAGEFGVINQSSRVATWVPN